MCKANHGVQSATMGTSNCFIGGPRPGSTNTRVTDLNISHPHRHGDRRSDVIANGVPLWNGALLAVATTVLSPPTRDGQP